MRNFWLPKLHHVKGATTESFASWITRGDFVFSSINSSTTFTIKILSTRAGLAALAHDCNKMAAASFETFLEISDSNILPKSCAWISLTTYYGAFYAAHAILRLCGTICFQVDAPQRQALEKVADLFGILPVNGIENGFYVGTFDGLSGEIAFAKTNAGSSGSHNVMWKIFNNELKRFSVELLSSSTLHSKSANFLTSISNSLCQNGTGGGWLSAMRNDVNYKLSHGAWFPYKGLSRKKKDLLSIAAKWKGDPMAIKLEYPKDPLSQQVATSAALAALCKLIVLDMLHTGDPKIFHAYGSASLLKLVKII